MDNVRESTAPADSDPFALDVVAVATHLAAHGMTLEVEAGAQRLSGGLSNLNYLVTVDGRQAVLRRPPGGELAPGAHDMAREHRILSRLSTVFAPAPDSFFLCTDPEVIGAPFQIMEHRRGRVVGGDRLPPDLDSPSAAGNLSGELVATLAALHRVDADAIGLGDFGRPDGFYRRSVGGWVRRAEALALDERPARRVGTISAWLGAVEPAPSAPTLLHSDFKLDNCMLDSRGRITTVLDWDMGTRGDPLMDLATLTSYWTESGDPECMHRLAQMPTARPGFLTRAGVVELYARQSGRDVSGFGAWRILALLKLGIIFIQLHRNWARGAAGDARYAGFAELGVDILDFAAASTSRPI
ncbi:phosphotransferase family protein [Aquibium microcysteis]|uniref:phosphotransferase family protein n=1 Tax=Aquibium microcysteis TaxID=675281 RepID=UPI00165CFEEA|nr:phosphotransferase family protein [Aquibium microcysteis]